MVGAPPYSDMASSGLTQPRTLELRPNDKRIFSILVIGLIVATCILCPESSPHARDDKKINIKLNNDDYSFRRENTIVVNGFENREHGLLVLEYSKDDLSKISPPDLYKRLEQLYGSIQIEIHNYSRPERPAHFEYLLELHNLANRLPFSSKRMMPLGEQKYGSGRSRKYFGYLSPIRGQTFAYCPYGPWECAWVSRPIGNVVVIHSVSKEILLSEWKAADEAFAELFSLFKTKQ